VLRLTLSSEGLQIHARHACQPGNERESAQRWYVCRLHQAPSEHSARGGESAQFAGWASCAGARYAQRRLEADSAEECSHSRGWSVRVEMLQPGCVVREPAAAKAQLKAE